MTYFLSYYVVLPILFGVVPLLALGCFFFCPGCEAERQRRRDEMQMKVARDLARAKRDAGPNESNEFLVVTRRKSA
jgi:hypothetical protein